MNKYLLSKILFLFLLSVQIFAFSSFNEDETSINNNENNVLQNIRRNSNNVNLNKSKSTSNELENVNLENVENINLFIKKINVSGYEKFDLSKGVSSIGMITYKKFIERRLHINMEDFLDATRLSEITSTENFNKVFEYKKILFFLIDNADDLSEEQKERLKEIFNKLYANKRINHLVTFFRRNVLGGISENCQ